MPKIPSLAWKDALAAAPTIHLAGLHQRPPLLATAAMFLAITPLRRAAPKHRHPLGLHPAQRLRYIGCMSIQRFRAEAQVVDTAQAVRAATARWEAKHHTTWTGLAHRNIQDPDVQTIRDAETLRDIAIRDARAAGVKVVDLCDLLAEAGNPLGRQQVHRIVRGVQLARPELDTQQIVDRYQAGASIRALAQECRCGANTIRQTLADAGVGIRDQTTSVVQSNRTRYGVQA